MILKIISSDGWNWDFSQAQLVKTASRGLRGHDRRQLIKRAGHEFADHIDSLNLQPGDVPVHVVALGAYERYGPNRNGDAFKEAVCRQYHDTFVKNAFWYRDHKNKDPEQRYGLIKRSFYNDAMARIELLAILNGTHAAAERNGGYIADRELARLEKDGTLSGSMACLVGHDVCNACGNKAKHRGEYCTSATCDAGGCRDNMMKVAADGRMPFVFNPDPDWFDYSDVGRPADPTAYGFRADYLQKAASDHVIGGAELAELLKIAAPEHLMFADLLPWLKPLAHNLKLAAEIEASLDNPTTYDRAAAAAIKLAAASTNWASLNSVRSAERCDLAGSLADAGVILPVSTYLHWHHGLSAEKAAQIAPEVAGRLPGAYQRLLLYPDLNGLLNQPHSQAEGSHLTKVASQHWDLIQQTSLLPTRVQERAIKAACRQPAFEVLQVKTAQAYEPNNEHVALADRYAIYKLAMISRLAHSPDFPTMLRWVVLGNHV